MLVFIQYCCASSLCLDMEYLHISVVLVSSSELVQKEAEVGDVFSRAGET